MTLAATKKPSLPGAMAASWVTFDAPAVRPCAVSTCRPGLRLVRGSVAVPSAPSPSAPHAPCPARRLPRRTRHLGGWTLTPPRWSATTRSTWATPASPSGRCTLLPPPQPRTPQAAGKHPTARCRLEKGTRSRCKQLRRGTRGAGMRALLPKPLLSIAEQNDPARPGLRPGRQRLELRARGMRCLQPGASRQASKAARLLRSRTSASPNKRLSLPGCPSLDLLLPPLRKSRTAGRTRRAGRRSGSWPGRGWKSSL